MERHAWQAVLKAELKEALSGLVMQAGAAFAGYYASTDPGVADTENTLFTNLLESMPSHAGIRSSGPPESFMDALEFCSSMPTSCRSVRYPWHPSNALSRRRPPCPAS